MFENRQNSRMSVFKVDVIHLDYIRRRTANRQHFIATFATDEESYSANRLKIHLGYLEY